MSDDCLSSHLRVLAQWQEE
ncbi:hypothetical protein I305_03286 [Cryptococcus gattii E566]|nr:hypothetical protein I305_03286 [Cryptococcus gattii E566]